MNRAHPAPRPLLLCLATALACGGSSAQLPPDGGPADPPGTVHVSPSGSDSAAGTAAAPWRTVQHAASSVTPGAIVYLHAGVYSERVTLTTSGTQASPITFTSAPGEHAVIDGTGLVPPQGTTGLFTLTDVSWVRLSGLELRGYRSNQAGALPAGIYYSGAGTNVEIRNCHVHAIETTAATLGGSGGAFGIAVYGTRTAPIDNLVLDGSEVDHLHTGSSESVVVNGNVTHFAITNNLVHDNDNIGIDAIGFEGTAPTPALDQARDGLIAGNTVYNISSYGNPAYGLDRSADGIYVDGGARIVVERNRISAADIGLELASEHQGQVTSAVVARSNLIYQCSGPGLSLGGFASNTGGTDGCTIVNNTFYQNDALKSGSGEMQFQYRAAHNRFANNLFFAGSQGLFVNGSAQSPAPGSSDYNLYWVQGGATPAWTWAGQDLGSLADLRSATGGEAHSLSADPRFLYAGPPDLRLGAGSPALGAGQLLDATLLGTQDVLGTPRTQGNGVDLGAYQSH